MGTILVSDIILKAGRVLSDETGIAWKNAEMLDWYNEAILDLVVKKPETLAIVETFECAAGTQQTVPANRLAIVAMGRNMGPALSPKNGNIPVTLSKEIMDRLCPTWQGDSAKAVISAVMPSKTPRLFYVSPPQPAINPGRLEVTFSVKPTFVTADTAATELEDLFMPAIVEYMLYRATSKDTENPQARQYSTSHLQAYMSMLGAGAPTTQG